MNPNIPRHAIWRPGMTWDDIGALDASRRHDMNPGASDPRARLADMDKMGVDQAFLYPTWFAEAFPLVSDPDTANALARAYNDWIASFCAADPRRLFAAAMLPLQDMDLALAELRRVARNPSFRGAFIRPLFIGDTYLTHPFYDPLWAELERLGLVAAVHPTSGLWNPEWTSHGPFVEKVKNRSSQAPLPAGGAGPNSGGGAGLASTTFFVAYPQLGHPMAPILSGWLDNHMFVASVLIGFTVMQRFPALKFVLAHGKASWMEEVLEKMEASCRVIPLLHKYPVRTDVEEMWEEGNVMLGFDADERFIHKMPHDFAEKVVWGSRYPQHDTMSAHEAIDRLADSKVPDDLVARMIGGNAAAQFGVRQLERAVT
jgi:predicted TIM-barrel fold metal-dependent hydrolase